MSKFEMLISGAVESSENVIVVLNSQIEWSRPSLLPDKTHHIGHMANGLFSDGELMNADKLIITNDDATLVIIIPRSKNFNHLFYFEDEECSVSIYYKL